MSNQILGRAFIRVNGATLATIPGSGKVNPGGVERTAVMGDAGFLGWTEKPVHGEIECEIAIDENTDIDALNKITDASITFECDTGQVFVMRHAGLSAPANVQSSDGKATLKFIGSATVQV